MTFHELDSVITRAGVNCKMIFCGDYRQSDLSQTNQLSGIVNFMTILEDINSFKNVSFDIDDIVRSGLVRDYIIAKAEKGIL